MKAPVAKKKIIALFCGGLAAVVLLGAVVAVSDCGRKVFSHFHHKLQPPRTAKDAVTGVPRDLDRHAQFLERAKQGDVDILFVGDSITDRWPRVGESSWLKLAKSKSANFGVEGECTEHLLWRLEHGELDGISPKVVVVLIGSNNVFYFADERPEWTASGVEKVVAAIRRRARRATPFGSLTGSNSSRDVEITSPGLVGRDSVESKRET
jgi:hypothetical protein